MLIYIVNLSFSDELTPSLGVVGMWDRGESGLTAHVSGLGSYVCISLTIYATMGPLVRIILMTHQLQRLDYEITVLTKKALCINCEQTGSL